MAPLAVLSRKTRIGISTAGLLEGTRLVSNDNTVGFVERLRREYDGDFARFLGSNVAVANDAVAGAKAGALEAKKRYPDANTFLYIINGSGIGTAGIVKGKFYGSEGGHWPLSFALNRYHIETRCDIGGKNDYVCIENAALGRNLEVTYQKLLGLPQPMGGHELNALLGSRNQDVIDLYGHSALLLAHAVFGFGNALGAWDEPKKTVVMFHGGVTKVPGYVDRVMQVIEKHLSVADIPTILTHRDIPGGNACLTGAAIGAFTG